MLGDAWHPAPAAFAIDGRVLPAHRAGGRWHKGSAPAAGSAQSSEHGPDRLLSTVEWSIGLLAWRSPVPNQGAQRCRPYAAPSTASLFSHSILTAKGLPEPG